MDDESTQPISAAGSAAEPSRPAGMPPVPPPPSPPGSANVPLAAHPYGAAPATVGAAPPPGPGYPAPPQPPGPGHPAPPYGSGPAGYGPRPPRHYPAPIGWVIAAVILFWPTAIPALLASHRAASAGGAGDVVTADREAATARRWSIVSVCVGGALIVLSILFSILWAVLVATAVHHDERFGVFEQRPAPGYHRQVNPRQAPIGPRGGMPFGPRGGQKVQPAPSPPAPTPSPTSTP